MSAYSDGRDWPQLAHIATDGESYGHHHRYGEMALSYALHHIEENEPRANSPITASTSKIHPPTHEVEIYESTRVELRPRCRPLERELRLQLGRARRLEPGVARVRCARPSTGCATKSRRMYEARIADSTSKIRGQARNDYIDVVLDRSTEVREAFLQRHREAGAEGTEQVEVWKLLELQRHAMLMYTSCGWFFDELSGIETVQVISTPAASCNLRRSCSEANGGNFYTPAEAIGTRKIRSKSYSKPRFTAAARAGEKQHSRIPRRRPHLRTLRQTDHSQSA